MIYIVEDDAAIRELEQYALQSSGYQVNSFPSSEPFWQAMRLSIIHIYETTRQLSIAYCVLWVL